VKAYLAVTAALFGALVVVHLWRAFEEGAHVAADPWFLLSTAVAAVLSVWGFRLLLVARSRRRLDG
jgi:hypothetical protein